MGFLGPRRLTESGHLDIIKSFGYSSLQTLLLLTPGGATTMVSIYIAAWFAVKVPNSRIAMLCFTCLFPIVGACMIWKGDWSHRGGGSFLRLPQASGTTGLFKLS